MGYKMTNDPTWTGVGGKRGPGGMFSAGLYSDAMVVLLQMNSCGALCSVQCAAQQCNACMKVRKQLMSLKLARTFKFVQFSDEMSKIDIMN